VLFIGPICLLFDKYYGFIDHVAFISQSNFLL